MSPPPISVFYKRTILPLISLSLLLLLCTSCEMIDNIATGLFEAFLKAMFLIFLMSILYFGGLALCLFNLIKWREKQIDLTEVIKYRIKGNKEKYPNLLQWIEIKGHLVSQIFPPEEIEYSEPIISLIDTQNNVVWQYSFQYYRLETALERLNTILDSHHPKANTEEKLLNPFAIEKKQSFIFLIYCYRLTRFLLLAPLLYLVVFMTLTSLSDIVLFIFIVYFLFITWQVAISLLFNRRPL